jgi:phenylalanyl-tRNA synthetase beta chain
MGEKNYHIGTPSWRNDIEHEVDLVEEIMRIYGFDHVPMDGKMQVSLGSFSGTGQRKLKEKAARALQSTGFFEIVNNSLGSQAAQQAFSEQPVQLSNPLSSDMAVMRSSLLPGMLQSAQYNRNRKNTDLKFYEFGRVYRSVKNGFEETEMLGMLMLGNATAESWQQKPKKLDFYDLKEASQAVMYATGSCPEPGSWNLSRVNSQLAQQYDIEGDCWYAEIAWSAIAGNKRPEGFKTAEPPRFPRMRRDLSLVVGKSVAYGDLEKIALSKKIGILQEINVFDVFEGKPLEADKKAVAISFSLGVADRTLTDVEADEAMKTLMTAFEQEAGALIRK